MTELMLYRGARRVERTELSLVDAPPSTNTWFPVRHEAVLSVVEQTLQGAGFDIAKSQFALSEDNARFFGTLDLTAPVTEGVTLTVGVRNSTDKTFPIGLCAGTRVFVCDNLAFSAEIYVSKKHTRFGNDRFREGIAKAVSTLHQYRTVEAERIGHYRERSLEENEAAACLLHAFESEVLTTRTLPLAVSEWRKPSQEEFAPRTAWSLFNAFTAALRTRQSNPAEFAALTMKLYRLMDGHLQKALAV